MTYAELGFEFLVPDDDSETTYIEASGRLRRADPTELAQLIATRTDAHPETAKYQPTRSAGSPATAIRQLRARLITLAGLWCAGGSLLHGPRTECDRRCVHGGIK
jgi:hypothetical protein